MPYLLDERTFDVKTSHLSVAEYPGIVPTVANGAQTTGAAVVAGSNDTRGQITCTSSATPAAGTQVTVTFGTKYPSNGVNSVPTIIVFGQTGASAAALPFANNISANGFTIDTNAAPAASTALKFGYIVLN